jgi:hypothetical protein
MNRFFIALAMVTVVAGCGRCVGTGECDQTVPYPQPGACDLPDKSPGEIGGKCRDTAIDFCDPGSWCIQGTCLPCGDPGEVCCAGTQCNSGVTCDLDYDGVNMCNGSCGQPGQPCCGLDCDPGSGALCADGVTCQVIAPGQCNGSTAYFFATIEKASRCAGPTIPIYADSWDEAKTCAEGALQMLGPDTLELTSPSPAPDPGKEYEFCKTSVGDPNGTTKLVNAYSDQDAEACAIYTNCALDHDDTCKIAPGACPP